MTRKTVNAPSDGVTDATTWIQGDADNSSDLFFGPGTYLYKKPLLVKDAFSWELHEDATLLQGFATGGGPVGAGIHNVDLTVPLQGGEIMGRGRIRSLTQQQTGNLISLFCHGLDLRDFTIDQYGPNCRAIIWAGDDTRLRDLDIYGGPNVVGSAGARFVGGKKMRASRLYIISGDDCFQLVPSGSQGPMFDMDIEDALYEGGSGKSYFGKFLTAGLQTLGAVDGVVTMHASISGGWSHNVGEGAYATRVQNLNSDGSIDVTSLNNQINQTYSKSKTSEIMVRRSPGCGPVRLKLVLGKVRNPQVSTVETQGDVVLVTRDFDAVRGADPAKPVFDLTGKFTVGGGILDGKGSTLADVVRIDTGLTINPTDGLVDGAEVVGIGAGRFGVGVANATKCDVARTKFAGAGKAVNVAKTSTDTRLIDNDYTSLPDPVPVVDAGVRTIQRVV